MTIAPVEPEASRSLASPACPLYGPPALAVTPPEVGKARDRETKALPVSDASFSSELIESEYRRFLRGAAGSLNGTVVSPAAPARVNGLPVGERDHATPR